MLSSVSTLERPATAPAETLAPAAPVCDCGATLAPNGRCYEIGVCERADTGATRGAARTSAKYRPAAWTFAGGVD